MPLIKVRLCTTILLAAVALTLAALMQTLHDTQIFFASEPQSSAPRSQSDAGGQAASPNPSSGFDQEERVRQLLAKQYDKLYADEKSIRQFLNLRGKVADFIGHNSTTDQWLIAESKASDIDSAFEQLRNTTQAFVKIEPNAHFELRLFLDAKNFAILDNQGEIFGWRINTASYLGWQPESSWVDATIQGVKILVQRVP